MTPQPVQAYAADKVFDGDRFCADHAVVIAKDQISALLPVAELSPNTPVDYYPGCTLVPGLIDTHMHFLRWQGPVFLAYGVTTVRDTGNDLPWILQCRTEWRDRPWPRILSLGPLIDGDPPGHALVAYRVSDAESAVAAVRATAAAGVDGIKLYASIAAEWIAPMAAASHEAGRKISMHCLPHGVLVAGHSGIDEFYHLDGILADIWPDHPPGWLHVWGDPGIAKTWDRQQRVADEIAALGLVSTPTLAYWDSQWRMRLKSGPWPEEQAYMPADLFKWSSAVPESTMGHVWQRALEAAQRFQCLLNERGVVVLAGSDTPCGGILPGQSLWRELMLLTETGLSPAVALRAATAAAADFLERPRLGRLAAHCVADLAIVRGDLSRALPDRPEVELVVHSGTPHRPADLLRQPNDPTWRSDPWARQFEQHWTKRMQA